MKKPRRQRYYAYNARQGGLLWMDQDTHEFMQRRPHTVSHFQCKDYSGWNELMTEDEWKAKRDQWRKALTSGAFWVV